MAAIVSSGSTVAAAPRESLVAGEHGAGGAERGALGRVAKLDGGAGRGERGIAGGHTRRVGARTPDGKRIGIRHSNRTLLLPQIKEKERATRV